MGLAASQCRLLSLTSRLSDLELRAQSLSNQKVSLATASSQASSNYINALNNQYVNMWNENGTYTQATADSLTCFNASTGADQLFLQNDLGQVMCNDKIFNAWNDCLGIDGEPKYNKFLEAVGCPTGAEEAKMRQELEAMNPEIKTINNLVDDITSINTVLGGLQGAYDGLAASVGLDPNNLAGEPDYSKIAWNKDASSSTGGLFEKNLVAIEKLLIGNNDDTIDMFSELKGIENISGTNATVHESAATLLQNVHSMVTLKDCDVDSKTGNITFVDGNYSTELINIYRNKNYIDIDMLKANLSNEGYNLSGSKTGNAVVIFNSLKDGDTSKGSLTGVLDGIQNELKKQFTYSVSDDNIDNSGNLDSLQNAYESVFSGINGAYGALMSEAEYNNIIKPIIETAKLAVITHSIKRAQCAEFPGNINKNIYWDNDNVEDPTSDSKCESISDYYNDLSHMSDISTENMYLSQSDYFTLDMDSVINEFMSYFNQIMNDENLKNKVLASYYGAESIDKVTNDLYSNPNYEGKVDNIYEKTNIDCIMGDYADAFDVTKHEYCEIGNVGTCFGALGFGFMCLLPGINLFPTLFSWLPGSPFNTSAGANILSNYVYYGDEYDEWRDGIHGFDADHTFLYGDMYITNNWDEGEWSAAVEVEYSLNANAYELTTNLGVQNLEFNLLNNDIYNDLIKPTEVGNSDSVDFFADNKVTGVTETWSAQTELTGKAPNSMRTFINYTNDGDDSLVCNLSEVEGNAFGFDPGSGDKIKLNGVQFHTVSYPRTEKEGTTTVTIPGKYYMSYTDSNGNMFKSDYISYDSGSAGVSKLKAGTSYTFNCSETGEAMQIYYGSDVYDSNISFSLGYYDTNYIYKEETGFYEAVPTNPTLYSDLQGVLVDKSSKQEVNISDIISTYGNDLKEFMENWNKNIDDNPGNFQYSKFGDGLGNYSEQDYANAFYQYVINCSYEYVDVANLSNTDIDKLAKDSSYTVLNVSKDDDGNYVFPKNEDGTYNKDEFAIMKKTDLYGKYGVILKWQGDGGIPDELQKQYGNSIYIDNGNDGFVTGIINSLAEPFDFHRFYSGVNPSPASAPSDYDPNWFYSHQFVRNSYTSNVSENKDAADEYLNTYLSKYQDGIVDWVKKLGEDVNKTITSYTNLRDGYDSDGDNLKTTDDEKGYETLLKEAIKGVDGDKNKPGLKSIIDDYIAGLKNDCGEVVVANSLNQQVKEFIDKYCGADIKFDQATLTAFDEEFNDIVSQIRSSAGYIDEKEAEDEGKIEYYTNVYNCIKNYGLARKPVSEENWNNKEWLNEQLLIGNIHTSVCYEGYLEKKPYSSLSYLSVDTLNEELISRAQAEYEAEVSRISKKEKKIDRELSLIETEHTALESKVEEIKSTQEKNIERGFNLFS